MAKHIWIFEPSPAWPHVGGAAIGVADTYERAVELLHAQDGVEEANYWRRLIDIPGLSAEAYEEGRGFYSVPVDDPRATSFHCELGTMAADDNWILSADYELATEVEEKTILNYNYA